MTRYSADHVWVRIADGVATVGITGHAQAALGEITYVALKKPGTAVAQGGTLGVLESAKTASDFVAPISGRIRRVNPVVMKKPGRINDAPLGEGWICELAPDDPAQAEALLDEAAYHRLC
jgi:glycine cleavage system H protein